MAPAKLASVSTTSLGRPVVPNGAKPIQFRTAPRDRNPMGYQDFPTLSSEPAG